jgi:NADH-quinone oxidoreductase subunit A
MSGLMNLVGLTALGVAVVITIYLVHRLAIGTAPTVVNPYQSGALPQEHALSRYHARWYLATLIFLAFDVEMLFMYPWAVVVAFEGIGAAVEMFLFLALLLVAVFWARREGALRWA